MMVVVVVVGSAAAVVVVVVREGPEGGLCRMRGKRHSGGVVGLGGFEGMEVEGEARGGKVVMSCASQADSSGGEGGSVVMVMWAESVRAEVQRVAESERRERRAFLRSAESEGLVSGLRIVRIRWTVDSILLAPGVEAPRA